MFWERLASAVTGRLSWLIALAVCVLAGVLMAVVGGNDAGNDSPVSVPPSSESARNSPAPIR